MQDWYDITSEASEAFSLVKMLSLLGSTMKSRRETSGFEIGTNEATKAAKTMVEIAPMGE